MSATKRFINRELSWIEFNQRVLLQAQCESNPLLERLKFLSITGSNLDEFQRVRVGGLQILDQHSPAKKSPDGLTAAEQLRVIRQRLKEFKTEQFQTFQQLETLLEDNGIHRLKTMDVLPNQLEYLETRFDDELLNIFTPIPIHPDEEFPLLIGANLAVLICVQNEDLDVSENPSFFVVPIRSKVNRFMSLSSKRGYEYILVEDVIKLFVDKLFPGKTIESAASFRVLRNADMRLNEDTTSDLLQGMEQILDARKTSDCVALEIESTMSSEMLELLHRLLDVDASFTYPSETPLDLSSFFELVQIQGFDALRDQPWPPQPAAEFPVDGDIFETIEAGDRMLVHPYQSYDPVTQFVQAAANDKNVLAIKQTLYRTAKNSKIAAALMEAAKNGKSVSVIVELKARFDEARNIDWARKLEEAGADVIYGIRGVKTHAKVCVVVRKEPQGIRRYIHFGTGNYNESTSKIYSDISLFTCDEQLGNDAVSFFNAISGYSTPQALQLLVYAPTELRQTLLELIQNETQNAIQGKPASIDAKLNSLVDKKIVETLYDASRAGVKIRLNIRGICTLRPQFPKLSENIVVTSIVDRFLEHARIFSFHNDGNKKLFIASADWMGRNLDQRIELMVPVLDEQCKNRLTELLEIYFSDNMKTHVLDAEGNYQPAPESKSPVRAQQWLYQLARNWFDEQQHSQSTVFIPHRGEIESA